jgi:hypothetical protein
MTGEFSVCQFFTDDGGYEYVRRYVDVQEAMRAFIKYTTNVVARVGIVVERVIVTDGGDCTVMEWQRGKGYVHPPEIVGRQIRPDWNERLGNN